MRLLAVDPGADNVKRVTVDGKAIANVCEADEEQGYVLVVMTHEEAWRQYKQSFAPEVMPIIKLTGKVVIEFENVS